MSDYTNTNLIDIVTPSLQLDSDVQNSMAAMQPVWKALMATIPIVQFRSNISAAPDVVLDYLAVEFNVFGWSPSLPRVTRETLIRQAVSFNVTLGTPGTLLAYITILLGPCAIQEWWQYNGVPFHFRVALNTSGYTTAQLLAATNLVNQLKNVRSQFDGFFTAVSAPVTNGYVSTACVITRTVIGPMAMVP